MPFVPFHIGSMSSISIIYSSSKSSRTTESLVRPSGERHETPELWSAPGGFEVRSTRQHEALGKAQVAKASGWSWSNQFGNKTQPMVCETKTDCSNCPILKVHPSKRCRKRGKGGALASLSIWGSLKEEDICSIYIYITS